MPSPALTDLIDLSRKRALVTGGGGGSVPRSLLAFAKPAPTSPSLTSTRRQSRTRRRSAPTSPRCDITDAADLANAVDVAAGSAGIDILVNNAGIFPTTGPLARVTDEFVHRMLDVNVRAQFSATHEAVDSMPNGGAIVNMASVAALRGGANISAYAASKAAVVTLTRAHAHELGPKGIRVNAIAPGIIDTPGVQEQMAPLKAGGLDIDKRIAANPVGIAGQPDHIACGVLFLVSDLARFVSGHLLVIDGGSTA